MKNIRFVVILPLLYACLVILDLALWSVFPYLTTPIWRLIHPGLFLVNLLLYVLPFNGLLIFLLFSFFLAGVGLVVDSLFEHFGVYPAAKELPLLRRGFVVLLPALSLGLFLFFLIIQAPVPGFQMCVADGGVGAASCCDGTCIGTNILAAFLSILVYSVIGAFIDSRTGAAPASVPAAKPKYHFKRRRK